MSLPQVTEVARLEELIESLSAQLKEANQVVHEWKPAAVSSNNGVEVKFGLRVGQRAMAVTMSPQAVVDSSIEDITAAVVDKLCETLVAPLLRPLIEAEVSKQKFHISSTAKSSF